MIKVKNISGVKKYFGLGYNHRGFLLENNATATIRPDQQDRMDQVIDAIAAKVESGDLQVIDGPADLLPVKSVVSGDSPYQLTQEDFGRVIEVNASAGAVVLEIDDEAIGRNFRCDVVATDVANAISVQAKAGSSIVITSKGLVPAVPTLTVAFSALSIYKVPTDDTTVRVIGDVV